MNMTAENKSSNPGTRTRTAVKWFLRASLVLLVVWLTSSVAVWLYLVVFGPF